MESNQIGILDVPDAALFSVATIDQLVDAYNDLFDLTPASICLPVSSAGGLSYKSKLGIKNVAPMRDGTPYDLQTALGAAQRKGLQIYLCINPTLPYATSNTEYALVDSVGDETGRCCIVNKYTQAVIHQCIEETTSLTQARGVKVSGYVFTIQNILPLTANGINLEYNCWCRHCREALAHAEPDLEVDLLANSPGPANLMLQDAGEGIISIRDIDYDSSPADLLAAAERNKISISELHLSESVKLKWARQAWLYIRARDTITCAALQSMLEKTPESSSRCLINDRFAYDWSTGMFLASAAALPVQEMWLPPGPSPKVAQEVKTYLAIRGRYYVDALFDFINYVNRLGSLSPGGVLTEDLSQRWLGVAGKLDGALHLSKMDILPVIDARRSFVAPLVTSQSLLSLMEALGIRFTTDLGRLSQLLDYLGKKQSE